MYDDVLLDDTFNPKFVHFSPVSDGELDPFRRLPKAALIEHLDAALEAWGRSCDVLATPADIRIDYLEPVIGAQTLRIDIWVEDLDDSSCTYGFLCSSENGNLAYARGERTLVKSGRSAWNNNFRSRNEALMRNLRAFA
ncbi:MAG TPA: hotdog fold domain-containing protein [Thermoanaerobaculia bacterium]|nr:hotdog fold domain-containing protein [Thermoanaerobaculia bacterium]